LNLEAGRLGFVHRTSAPSRCPANRSRAPAAL